MFLGLRMRTEYLYAQKTVDIYAGFILYNLKLHASDTFDFGYIGEPPVSEAEEADLESRLAGYPCYDSSMGPLRDHSGTGSEPMDGSLVVNELTTGVRDGKDVRPPIHHCSTIVRLNK